MNIRLQTWFPYHVQMCLNGREWLRRCLERKGIGSLAQGNKSLHISDYEQAQNLLNKQLDVRFTKIPNGFVPTAFPMMKEILGPHFSYCWTIWQSEWATDLIFPSPAPLKAIMDSLLRHAHMIGTSTHVLRHLDRPLTTAGKPDARSKDQVLSRLTEFNDGIRVRHWVDKYGVKVYNQQNVLRFETTINTPGKFRVFRHRNGQLADDERSRLPLRKEAVDIPLRAKVFQEINDRFMHDLSMLKDQSPAWNPIDEITCRQKQNGRSFRPLDSIGKDRELLRCLSNPKFRISGSTNKMLREYLSSTNFGKGLTERQLSAKTSRHFRLLRVHGLIRKLPKQNRYQLTLKGVKLTNVLNAFFLERLQNNLLKWRHNFIFFCYRKSENKVLRGRRELCFADLFQERHLSISIV